MKILTVAFMLLFNSVIIATAITKLDQNLVHLTFSHVILNSKPPEKMKMWECFKSSHELPLDSFRYKIYFDEIELQLYQIH